MWNFFFDATMAAFIFVCVFLILLVLIQKGRGGGLSSAFGGAGGNTAFGSKTGDVLTWATSILFGIFILLAVGLNLLASPPKAAPAATQPIGTTPVDAPITPSPAPTSTQTVPMPPTSQP